MRWFGSLTRAVLAVALLGLAVAGCGNDEVFLLPNPANTQGTIGSLAGLVVSGGNPVGGVAIRTEPPGATGITDGVGRYSLAGVLPGVTRVIAEKPGFLTAFETVVVVANRTSTADLVLFAQSGAGILRGQVTDGFLGLAGVRISTVPTTQEIVTGPDGRYEFSALTPGQYTVRAFRPGYDRAERVVQVQEGRTTVQDFALGARIDGIVDGVVTDPAGAPLANTRVDLLFGGDRISAFTDLQGRYTFFNLTTGFYVLSATRGGFLPGSKGVDVRGGSVANGDLVLYLTSTPPVVPGSVTGTVFDTDDLTVAGATVTLSVAATPASTLTQADGTFTFVGVAPGSVTVTVTPPAPVPGGPVYGPGSRTLDVASGATGDGSLALPRL